MGRPWGGYAILVFMFGIIPALALWDTCQHPHPEIAQQWTLDDGTVCRTFRGSNGVTCTR